MLDRTTWLTLALALGLSALGISCIGGQCPCGSDPDQPLSEHDLTFAGEHTLNEGCACRCGPSGDLEERPPDNYGTCDHADTECEDADGKTRKLLCD